MCKTVTFSPDLWGKDLAQWDKNAGCFTLQPGELEIMPELLQRYKLRTKLNITK
jgi:hypothetical protein